MAMLLSLALAAGVQLVHRNRGPAATNVESFQLAALHPELSSVPRAPAEHAARAERNMDPRPIDDPSDRLASMLADNSPDAADTFREEVRQWAEKSPAAASTWAAGLKDGPARSTALQQVAIAWANIDLPAVVEWLHSLPADHSKPDAVLAFTYEAARIDPRNALQEARELEPTPERDLALLHTVSQWSAIDDASALAWSLQANDPALRERLVSAVAVAAAEKSPVAAAKLATLALEPGVQQDNTAVSIVQRWGQSDPEAAADWITQFPDTPARLAAMNNLVAIWAQGDPSGLEKWASAQPASVLRDTALSTANEALGSSGGGK